VWSAPACKLPCKRQCDLLRHRGGRGSRVRRGGRIRGHRIHGRRGSSSGLSGRFGSRSLFLGGAGGEHDCSGDEGDALHVGDSRRCGVCAMRCERARPPSARYRRGLDYQAGLTSEGNVRYRTGVSRATTCPCHASRIGKGLSRNSFGDASRTPLTCQVRPARPGPSLSGRRSAHMQRSCVPTA